MTAVVVNFTPVDRPIYKIGVPTAGEYEVVICSNDAKYGGCGGRKEYIYKTKKQQYSDMKYTLTISIEGNTALYIKKRKKEKK